MKYTGNDNRVLEFFHNTGHRISSFFRRVYRIIQWIPIIWNDRDWDWAYALKIMDYKLKRMSDNFSSTDYHDNTESLKQIKIARTLIARIYENDYGSRKTDALEAEYGVSREYNFIKDETGEYYKMEAKWVPEQSPEQVKFLDKLWHKAHLDGEKQMKYELDYLFRFMSKHIRKWWN